MHTNSDESHMVRDMLAEFLASPPQGFRTEPVYSTPHELGYRYARQFTLRLLNCPHQALIDDPVEAFNGDIFLGLDLKPNILREQAGFYQHLRHIGVQVHFVCDLLPALRTDAAPDGVADMHSALQSALAQADGVVCTSRALVDELKEWLDVFGPKRLRPLKLGWFDEGANAAPQKESVADGADELAMAGKFPVPTLTGKESTQYLLDVILGGQWYQQWMPDEVHRFWGSDSRLGTQVGQRAGRDIVSTGQAGYLIFGPYISLVAGSYAVKIRGALGENGTAGARMDVAADKGVRVLGESALVEPDEDGCLISLPVSLDTPCTDLEVRVWVGDDTDLKVSMISIELWHADQDSGDAASEAIATVGESMDQNVVLAAVEVLAEHLEASNDEIASESLPATSTVDTAPEITATAADSLDQDAVLAAVEALVEHPAASNDEAAPERRPMTSAVRNYFPPSSTQRNQAKAKRKKRR
jgi:hypothetical protein